MSELISRFCDIDDFCNGFDPLYQQRLLQDGQRHRVRKGPLSLSALMTLIGFCHRSGYRDFKRYYTQYGARSRRSDFPARVSSQRFVERRPRALGPRCGYLPTRRGRGTGITGVESTPLAGCPHQRSRRQQVFDGDAPRGKSSMGGDWGFKRPLMINDGGDLLAFRVTRGEVDDREPVWQMAQDRFGDLDGDRGSIAKALHDDLLAKGLKLIPLIRRNLKPRLMKVGDRLRLRKRFLIETVNDQLKNVSQIEHSGHRSLSGFMINVVGGRIASTFPPKKPSLGLRIEESGRPVVI